MPIVSISVALLLFEGGLTLRLGELKEVGKVIITLIIAGALITWIIAAGSAYYILELDLRIAILLGAIFLFAAAGKEFKNRFYLSLFFINLKFFE